VQSVNAGVVLLSGDAASLDDHLRALEVTQRVPGVRQVSSEIKSPDTVADIEIYKQRPGAADSRAAAQLPTDMWITSAIKLRLLANSSTPALDINVDTYEGAVTLFGIVPSEQAKTAAAAEARKVNGVKHVDNALQVVPKPAQAAVQVHDDELVKRVDAALDARPPLRDADINVEVKNGVVRLTGAVPSEGQRLEAAIIARSVTGVRSVQDDLRVQTTQG
jgi:hyperosmotically inducible periplasmic protein